MKKIEFDAKNHVYRVGGIVQPGPTEVIERMIGRPEFIDEKYMIRGKNVHKATQYHDEGGVDESTLTEEEHGFFRGWLKFREENPLDIDFSSWLIEIILHSKYGYLGTIDRLPKKYVIDIKTGAYSPTYDLQLHSYRNLAYEFDGIRRDMLLIMLKVDGTYRLKKIKYQRKIWNDFLTLLAAHKISKKYKN